MTKRITIFADGLCEPCNPGGYGCCAWIAFEGDVDGSANAFRPPCIASSHGCIGHGAGMTNNIAEYRAVRAALRWAADKARYVDVELCTDSQLVVRQINGQCACNADYLKVLRDECRELLMQLPNAKIVWVARAQNDVADVLTRVAYEQARKKVAA